MKFYRYKQVQRLAFFGFDDVLITDASSLSKRSPQTTTATINNDTKLLRFNVNNLYHTQLSQNAKIVIEQIRLPAFGNIRAGPITIRMKNLNTNSYDSQNNGLNSTLLYTTEFPLEPFQNPYPKILYNYAIPQNFFQNGYVEFEITYPNINVNLPDMTRFMITFVVYDVDEEELVLKDTPNVDFKNYGDNIKYLHGLSK